MDDKGTAGAPATPGRQARAAAASGWGRADLLRRAARLPIASEARARVVRFVEEEIARARAEWMRDAVPLAGLKCPKCEAPVEEPLRESRRQDELTEAVATLGLDKLTPEELDAILGKKEK